ncbi:hypothetical protein EDB89DRAFT_1912735 [Lactarius sanguifluus]|nr:hypothetical protein EDB89DRAFT_1912735 [Lactarius sanguifluus]
MKHENRARRNETAFPDHGNEVKPERVRNDCYTHGFGREKEKGGKTRSQKGEKSEVGDTRVRELREARDGLTSKVVESHERERLNEDEKGIDNSIIHSSTNTIAFIHPSKLVRSVKWGKGRQGVVSREEVDGWKHEANARQETRVASKVGELVKKGAWPNDSAGDLNDAHYEYKRKVRKYRSAEGEDVVEAIEVERMIEEWLEAVGVAIRDEVNPTLGVRRGRERRGHDEARNDEETRWEKERTGTRRDEENKDE